MENKENTTPEIIEEIIEEAIEEAVEKIEAESPEKRAAVEKMENIFGKVDAIIAEEKKSSPEKAEEQEELTRENNKKEIEMITRTTLTEDEIKAKELAEEEKQKKKNRSLAYRAVLAVVLVAAVMFGGYVFADILPQKAEGTVVITIPQGAGTATIAKELKSKKLIHSEFSYKVASRLFGMDRKYNYGKFELSKSGGYSHIFKTLSAPGNVIESVRVTIPEGYEIYKLADLLEQKGLIDKDKFYYLIDNGNFDYDFIEKIPEREMRLEGYLFPDTYDFVPNDEYGIINEMLKRFEQFYLKYESQINSSGYSMDEIITLASIIEREAGSADKYLVSSVFHNRLKSYDYPYLQSCATVQYVLKERKSVLSLDDTKIDSPYNTYINKGLPVGPIASCGEESIEAALNPADTNYYFFVMGSDGKHHFSTTFNEHINNKNGM